MELYVIVRNFSYYHESNTFYLNCQVKEKFISADENHPAYDKFQAVRKNEQINLKKKLNNAELLLCLPLVAEDLLAVTVNDWEQAQNCKSSDKFILKNLRKCAILEANSFANTASITQHQS